MRTATADKQSLGLHDMSFHLPLVSFGRKKEADSVYLFLGRGAEAYSGPSTSTRKRAGTTFQAVPLSLCSTFVDLASAQTALSATPAHGGKVSALKGPVLFIADSFT